MISNRKAWITKSDAMKIDQQSFLCFHYKGKSIVALFRQIKNILSFYLKNSLNFRSAHRTFCYVVYIITGILDSNNPGRNTLSLKRTHRYFTLIRNRSASERHLHIYSTLIFNSTTSLLYAIWSPPPVCRTGARSACLSQRDWIILDYRKNKWRKRKDTTL